MIVLAVDNNPADLKLLCDAVRSVHPKAKIVHFIDPMLAFKYSVSHPVDMLYTTVAMKRMGGFKLEKMVREDHPEVAVTFISKDLAYKEKAIQHMASGYLVKPVTAEKLAAAEAEDW